MIRNRAFSVALTAFFLTACGGGGYSADSITDQAPQGLMEGEDWEMVSAVVVADDDDGTLSVSLYPIQVDDCDGFADADSRIIFDVKREAGEYPLNFSLTDPSANQTITFVPAPAQNIIATEGLVVVESLTDDEVTIGLVADADTSSIDGRFTTMICPDPF